MRLGDLDALRKNMEFICMGIMAGTESYNAPLTEIDNAPPISIDWGIDSGDRTVYARPQDVWISVSERLPEYSGLYLVSVDDLVTVANFTGSYFMHSGGDRIKVYAWQPLPEPYKEGGAE